MGDEGCTKMLSVSPSDLRNLFAGESEYKVLKLYGYVRLMLFRWCMKLHMSLMNFVRSGVGGFTL